jgi:hypothetical protein
VTLFSAGDCEVCASGGARIVLLPTGEVRVPDADAEQWLRFLEGDLARYHQTLAR